MSTWLLGFHPNDSEHQILSSQYRSSDWVSCWWWAIPGPRCLTFSHDKPWTLDRSAARHSRECPEPRMTNKDHQTTFSLDWAQGSVVLTILVCCVFGPGALKQLINLPWARRAWAWAAGNSQRWSRGGGYTGLMGLNVMSSSECRHSGPRQHGHQLTHIWGRPNMNNWTIWLFSSLILV